MGWEPQFQNQTCTEFWDFNFYLIFCLDRRKHSNNAPEILTKTNKTLFYLEKNNLNIKNKILSKNKMFGHSLNLLLSN